MLKRLKRINILVPKKEETRLALKAICATIREAFGGYTKRDVIIISPANGDWTDPLNGKVVSDKHTSIDVDVKSSNGTKIINRIANIKKTWEKQFNEHELYITMHSVARIL